MFDNFKVANYDNVLLSPELYARHLTKLLTGDVVDGFTVIPGTGLQVILQAPGNALLRYGAAKVASSRLVSLVDDFPLAITTPDVSNPRIDSVVSYVDTSVSLPGGTPTSANLDGPGVAKAIVVAGTPNANPTAPSAAMIQAAIGSATYPYIVVVDVTVDPGVSVIAANKIADRRSMAKMTASHIDFGGTGSGIWWEEIGRATLGSTADTITLSNLPARKYLKLFINILPSGGTNSTTVRFNNDATATYAIRASLNGAADSTATGQTFCISSDVSASTRRIEATITNITNIEKIVAAEESFFSAAGASTAPSRRESTSKWVNTFAQINRIDVINTGAGDYASGSELIVLGHN